MRTDAKIGFAIGGVLLAVLTVYAIVVPRHSKKPANSTVTLVTPQTPAASSEGAGGASGTGSKTDTPPLGAADGGQTQPTPPVTPPVNPVNPGLTPGPTPSPNNLADNNGGQNGFHPVPPGGSDVVNPDHKSVHLDNGGVYIPDDVHHEAPVARRDPVKPLPDDNDQPANTHYTVYTVKSGQTLSKIAYEVYGNSRFWVAIQRENKTLDPKHLKPGMKINLPDISPVQPGTEVVSDEHVVTPPPSVVHTPSHTAVATADGRTYTVQSGDSLYAIAKRLLGSGRKADALYDLNKDLIGPDKSRLKLGMVLKLPEGATHTAMVE